MEIEPELDLPLWSFLSSRAPDWMLPGAGDLMDGDVVALSTNPVFVESLLVGANYQATAELRWRNIPLVTRWSPLRKFWERKANDVDILPIKSWPDIAPFGDVALMPPGRSVEARAEDDRIGPDGVPHVAVSTLSSDGSLFVSRGAPLGAARSAG